MMRGGIDLRTIYQKVGCVIAIFDEYTGRPINGDFCNIHRETTGVILYKGNGIYVILGDVEEGEEISIESEMYQTKTIKIDDKNTTYYVWMMPRMNSRDRLSATALRITDIPENNLQIILTEVTMPYRLLEDVQKNSSTIKIYSLKYDVLCGRTFLIEDGSNSEEIIIMGNDSDAEDDNTYNLSSKLGNSYNAGSSRIFPVIPIEVDSDGNAFAIVRNVTEERVKCRVVVGKKSENIELKHKQMLTVSYNCFKRRKEV